jgi:peptide subunit release factor 1 (eRF1)
MIREIPAEPTTIEKLSEIVTASPNGAAIFWSDETKCLVVPPFPVAEKVLLPSLDVAPLRSQLAKDYHIGVVLVRLGSYSAGVCRGDKLVTSKVGTGLVHGRHRQGGSSSNRFERHRDKQIEQFLIRVCGHVREQLEPYERIMDYIVYGGAKKTILMAQKYCPFLMKLDKPVLPPLLDILDPRHAVLESAVVRLWSSTVYEWREDQAIVS